MTITINGEPLEVQYEKALTGELHQTTIPNTNPPVTVKTERFSETLTVKEKSFEILRKIATTSAGSRQTFEYDGHVFQSLEALVNHLLTV